MKYLPLLFANLKRKKIRTTLTIGSFAVAMFLFGLLADEPTGDLDATSAGEILQLLERLNREFKKTIVMVTHDPTAAERAGIVRRLDKGQLA